MKATPALREWLWSAMAYRGWNQKILADESGITNATWSRFFSGTYRNLSPPTVDAVCRLFGVTEIELYRIAHQITVDPDAESLARWIEQQPEAVRESVFRAAKRKGWQSNSNQP